MNEKDRLEKVKERAKKEMTLGNVKNLLRPEDQDEWVIFWLQQSIPLLKNLYIFQHEQQ